MTIEEEAKQKFELGPAFHFTLIENLADILSEGGLLSKALVQHRLKGDLSHPEIQEARRTRIVPGTGRSVHEFVPLYFGFKTPMLALRQDRNEDISIFGFRWMCLACPAPCSATVTRATG